MKDARQQGVISSQIHARHGHARRCRQARGLAQQRPHHLLRQRPTLLQQLQHDRTNTLFTFLAGQVQQTHILLVGTPWLLRHQGIVGPPIGLRRIQILPVDVARKGPWLTHQPADNVPVVDVVLILTSQPRHPLHQRLAVPYLDLLHTNARFHLLTNQTRRHRIGVVLDPNGAAAPHRDTLPLQRLQPLTRQRLQLPHLLLDLGRPARIPLRLDLLDQAPILLPAAEVATATQQQCLINRLLEMTMRRLRISVLVGAGRIGGLGLDPVMGQ